MTFIRDLTLEAVATRMFSSRDTSEFSDIQTRQTREPLHRRQRSKLSPFLTEEEAGMRKLSEAEVLEKWSHIAMKVFPPQTEISPDADATVHVRWRAENDPDALSKRARGVDLHFSPAMMADYQDADAETELKWDAFIEGAISERLRGFDPYDAGSAEAAQWYIHPPAAGGER